MNNLPQLRKQVYHLWCKGKSIAQIECEMGVTIKIGGELGSLLRNIYFGNLGIYPR